MKMLFNLVCVCLLTFVSTKNIKSKECFEKKGEVCKDDLQESNDEHDDAGSCNNWSYPSNNWPAICSSFCGGERQSPISINVVETIFDNDELIYTNYNFSISTVNMKNNGHSASVSFDTSINTPSISGGGLSCGYTLAGFHFHWGCGNTEGSEHTLDGKRYAMEMHLVHYKTSYKSVAEAVKHGDGLAVLGVLFNIGMENKALKPITDNLAQIQDAGTDVDIDFNISLDDFLPSDNQTFHRYLGSLTTPSCHEAVVWTVLNNHVEVSQKQIDAFRLMKDHHHNPICNNYREVQPIYGRKITTFNLSAEEVLTNAIRYIQRNKKT